MRVALVNNIYVDQLGYFYVAAVLKQAGHDVEFFVNTANLERELIGFRPHLVGLTAVTGNHLWAAETAQAIKQFLPDTKTILGGPHPTYHPEIIKHPGLDFICRGEGESAIVPLVEAIANSKDTSNIAGIWTKRGDEIFQTPFADLIENLDSIPFPDRSIYKRFALTKRTMFPLMLTSRGCPFRCTFCYAPTLAGLVKDKGKFVRFRSVENVVNEALALRREYRVHSVDFVDDIFGMHRPWLREFSRRWRDEVNLPFSANLRADLVDDEAVELLRQAGCNMIAFGLESGNERVRNEILEKDVATEQIVAAAQQIKSAGIRLVTYNILGAPSETLQEAFDTLTLNQRIRPHYAYASVMQPYPGTKIFDKAVARGEFETAALDAIGPTFHMDLPMRIPDRPIIQNLQKMFNVAVQYPALTPVVNKLIRLRPNFLFMGLFLWNHAYGFFYRVKRVPAVFIVHLLLNMGELWRRYRSGLYKRELFRRPIGPSLKQRVESGAL